MATYTKTIGPSGADYTTLGAWQTARIAAAVAGSDDTEEAVLLDHSTHSGFALSTSWPAGVRVLIRGQNSHLNDWTVTSGGARFAPEAFSSTIYATGTYNSGVIFEIQNVVVQGHPTTSSRSAIWIAGSGLTFRAKRCLIAGQSSNSHGILTGNATSTTAFELENSVICATGSGGYGFNDTFSASSLHSLTATNCYFSSFYSGTASGQVLNPTLNGCLLGSISGGAGTKTATDSILSTGSWTGWTTSNCSTAAFVTGAPNTGEVGFTNMASLDFSLYDDGNNVAVDYCENITPPSTDILGVARPIGTYADAGPFELEPAPTVEPDAPTGLLATAVTVSSVRLNWTDNASNEQSYEVGYRTLGSSGAWTLASDAIAANATQYTVTGLAEGSYEFRVRATNIIGSSAYATATGATRATKPGVSKGCGINLERINYYTPEMPFRDIWLANGVWADLDGADQTIGLATHDANGNLVSWTGVKARCMLRVTDDTSQVYVLLYDGSGTFSVGNSTTVSSTAGRHEFRANSAIAWVDVTSLGTLTNFRCFRIEDEALYESQPFRSEFLSVWSGVRCFRYLNWTRVGNLVTGSASWSDRPTLTYRGTKYSEVALERIIAHSNATGKDCWINVPHIADDDFVENMAILFRDGITGSQKIYVEYSNECWNFGFTQTTYCVDQGVASSDPYVAAGADDYEKGRIWYGKRTKEVMDIWTTVFAGEEDRLVRVLAWQAAGDAADCMSYPGIVDSLDAIAIAPYVGGSYGGTGTHGSTPIATIIAAITDEIDTNLRPWVSGYVADWRDVYGLRIIGYEGGQHLYATSGDSAESDRFAEVNRDAGIYQFVQDYMTAWHEESNDLLCWYKTTSGYTQYGYWGLREDDTQGRDDAYKMDAYLDYIEANTTSGIAARRHALRLGLGLR